jgi:GNAT superfamily N-acetyltransferase
MGRGAMPKVRRRGVPEPLIRHLVRRARERGIHVNQLALLREWLLSEPEVPVGPWFNQRLTSGPSFRMDSPIIAPAFQCRRLVA